MSPSKLLLVTGNGSEDSCITKSSITCVSTWGLTIALGGHLSLTSSAVAAIGRPLSDVVLEGSEGTVPGIGVGWTMVDSTPLRVGLMSAIIGVSFASGWEDVAEIEGVYTLDKHILKLEL